MAKHFEVPYSFSDSGNMLNTYIVVIAVNTAFQMGFCTFVLSNYMKALSADLTEAALVDGAGIWRQYREIIMPLCRPAFAALGTLQVIFIYNDYFWPLHLHPERQPASDHHGHQQPAGRVPEQLQPPGRRSVITVIPTLVIYLLLQRQFVAGLTLGSSKG